MFRDREQELKRLEEELLEEEQNIPEDTDELLEQLYEDLADAPTPSDSQFYNGDRVDLDPEDLSDQLEQPKEKLTGLVITALLLTAGILAILSWWAVRLLG